MLLDKINEITSKLNNHLPKFMKMDKILHFGVCFILSFLLGTHGVALAFSASITKEFSDSINPNSYWSWGDIIADSLGIVIGYSLGLIIFNGDFILYFIYNLIY